MKVLSDQTVQIFSENLVSCPEGNTSSFVRSMVRTRSARKKDEARLNLPHKKRRLQSIRVRFESDEEDGSENNMHDDHRSLEDDIDTGSCSEDDDVVILEQPETELNENKVNAKTKPQNQQKQTKRKRSEVRITEDGFDDQGKTDKSFALASQPVRVSELADKISILQRHAINQIGFGGILDMEYAVDDIGGAELNFWLATHFRGEDAAVVVDGIPLFYLTPADVHQCFRLPLCPGRPVDDDTDNEVRSIRERWMKDHSIATGSRKRTSMNVVKKLLIKDKRVTPDWLRLFVAYVFSAFLIPVANGSMDFRTLKSTINIDEIKNYDWSSYVFHGTCARAIRYNGERGGKSKQIRFSGCMLLLLLNFIDRGFRPNRPVPNDRSLVKIWSQEALERSIKELSRGGRFDACFFENDATAQSSRQGECSMAHESRKRVISIDIPEGSYDDGQIDQLFPNLFQKNAAQLARNLEIVVEDKLELITQGVGLDRNMTFPQYFKESTPCLVDKIDNGINLLTLARDKLLSMRAEIEEVIQGEDEILKTTNDDVAENSSGSPVPEQGQMHGYGTPPVTFDHSPGDQGERHLTATTTDADVRKDGRSEAAPSVDDEFMHEIIPLKIVDNCSDFGSIDAGSKALNGEAEGELSFAETVTVDKVDDGINLLTQAIHKVLSVRAEIDEVIHEEAEILTMKDADVAEKCSGSPVPQQGQMHGYSSTLVIFDHSPDYPGERHLASTTTGADVKMDGISEAATSVGAELMLEVTPLKTVDNFSDFGSMDAGSRALNGEAEGDLSFAENVAANEITLVANASGSCGLNLIDTEGRIHEASALVEPVVRDDKGLPEYVALVADLQTPGTGGHAMSSNGGTELVQNESVPFSGVVSQPRTDEVVDEDDAEEQDDLYEYIDQYHYDPAVEEPWLSWPSNPASIYLSHVVQDMAAASLPSLPAYKLEAADFCITHEGTTSDRSSEPYDDGKLSLEFKDFVAFEKKKVIPTSIITAWGSHLNEDVEGRLPKSHICLPTIESFDWFTTESDIVSVWESGIQVSSRDIKQANMVFAPVNIGSHVFLIVLSFSHKEFQYLDSCVHKNMDQWKDAAHTIRRALGSWLRKMGHEHSVTLSRFGLNFVGGEWRSDTKKWDAGVFVMLLMATYQGNAENLTQHALLKEKDISRQRVEMCCELLLSTRNQNKRELMSSIPLFITTKISSALSDSSDCNK